ncbi:hypothetical protein [Acanthamoeba polyphaga mimivirus]|nr:hypothetical protein [Acanthamoeba castellanii mamavirus]AHA45347.1 hypothetical protein HIRU_S441 [Hirudovirus strain Sangsue]EJN40939.1 hypothetical protein lvs_R436 [Acanthamoeba polyphaga lentillevirus]QTF49426.1 hypothetical protein [Mimivirus reunion]UMZ07967.1 hypothetical protein [Acanthamoeba polyphaga mimivirus]WMV61869.1 hypothetical protein qu_535 [Mimivirus sp.]
MSKKVNKNASPKNNSDSESKTIIYRPNTIDCDRIDIADWNKDGKQWNAWLNYQDPNLNSNTKILLQTKTIELKHHGIPRIGEGEDAFIKSDADREYIKIPLTPGEPGCEELEQQFQALDEYFSSDEMRTKLFGKRANGYKYVTCVKTPKIKDESDSDSDDEDNKKKKKNTKNKGKQEGPPVKYIKAKFHMIQDNGKKINRTKLIKSSGGKKEEVNADTVTEIANEVRFLSKTKYIMHVNRIWAAKSVLPGADKKMYSLGVKVMAIEYTPGASTGLNSKNLAFMSDDEDEEEVVKPTKSPNKSSQKQKQKLDSDDEDSDNEKEKEKEEDDEEEHKSSNKSSNKKSKKQDDDEDDEEEGEKIEVKKSSKKSSKKASKKQDSDEEDEEEVAKPKKKSSKAKSPSKSRS